MVRAKAKPGRTNQFVLPGKENPTPGCYITRSRRGDSLGHEAETRTERSVSPPIPKISHDTHWFIIPRNPFIHNKATIPASLVKAVSPSAIQQDLRANWQWRLACQIYGCNGKKTDNLNLPPPPPTLVPRLIQYDGREFINMVVVYHSWCSIYHSYSSTDAQLLQCIKWTLEAASAKASNDSLQNCKVVWLSSKLSWLRNLKKGRKKSVCPPQTPPIHNTAMCDNDFMNIV